MPSSGAMTRLVLDLLAADGDRWTRAATALAICWP
jgi:hypothetical protein